MSLMSAVIKLHVFVLYGWGIEHHDGEYQINKKTAAPTI